jgi:hypothetical protein
MWLFLVFLELDIYVFKNKYYRLGSEITSLTLLYASLRLCMEVTSLFSLLLLLLFHVIFFFRLRFMQDCLLLTPSLPPAISFALTRSHRSHTCLKVYNRHDRYSICSSTYPINMRKQTNYQTERRSKMASCPRRLYVTSVQSIHYRYDVVDCRVAVNMRSTYWQFCWSWWVQSFIYNSHLWLEISMFIPQKLYQLISVTMLITWNWCDRSWLWLGIITYMYC